MFAVTSEFCFESSGEFVVVPVDVCFGKSEDTDLPVVHAGDRFFPFCCAVTSGKAVKHAKCVLVGVCPDCVPMGYIVALRKYDWLEHALSRRGGAWFPGWSGAYLCEYVFPDLTRWLWVVLFCLSLLCGFLWCAVAWLWDASFSLLVSWVIFVGRVNFGCVLCGWSVAVGVLSFGLGCFVFVLVSWCLWCVSFVTEIRLLVVIVGRICSMFARWCFVPPSCCGVLCFNIVMFVL